MNERPTVFGTLAPIPLPQSRPLQQAPLRALGQPGAIKPEPFIDDKGFGVALQRAAALHQQGAISSTEYGAQLRSLRHKPLGIGSCPTGQRSKAGER